MFNLFQLRKRKQVIIEELIAFAEKPVVKEKTNLQSKIVYAFVGNELKGEWDSVTKCATALGMSRPAVKKAIDEGTILDNGFKLTLTN
jgi:hypothetical protein